MWRQNVFRETPDSDLSISDEDDFDPNLPDHCDSSSRASEKKVQLQIPSSLEMLRGTLGWDCQGKSSNLSNPACMKETNVHLEDKVEMPESHVEGDIICSRSKAYACDPDEEMISDDEVQQSKIKICNFTCVILFRYCVYLLILSVRCECGALFQYFFSLCQDSNVLYNLFGKGNNVLSNLSIASGNKKFIKHNLCSIGCGKQKGEHTWSAASKEADELINLNKNAPCSSSHSARSSATKSYKGVRCKVQKKFSFRLQSCEEGLSYPSVSKDENDVSLKDHEASKQLDTIRCIPDECLNAKVLEGYQGENKILSEIVCAGVGVRGHGCAEQSMSERLDGLQDRASLLKGVSKKCSRTMGKRVQIVAKRRVSPPGNGTYESEDSPESVGGESSSEDEDKSQKVKLTVLEVKGQTMADRFDEALGASFLNNEGALVAVPKPSGIGLLRKLQQLMQIEKERDMDFLKKLQTGSNADDETSCIFVKILARCLDAKLTVCQCSFDNNLESGSPQTMENGRRKSTVIFNPRVSNDVDLEVGNLIRIHPPWKEIRVAKDESILLSTYFSQILI